MALSLFPIIRSFSARSESLILISLIRLLRLSSSDSNLCSFSLKTLCQWRRLSSFLLNSSNLTSHYINYTSIIHLYTRITPTWKSSLAFNSSLSFSTVKNSLHQVLICSASEGLFIKNILPSLPTPST